ncbi:CPBP family intramembrane glutamic endopeptidase [Chryseobacterium sp. PMSZPI]|uniref:CPBP family intramembrane glutamic endopeptidase n=1 Tax=Chryseobacterium sp. PMSZPI TaxID=1033900 RepID=UPI000C330D18|nr:hypothetical protein CW752_14730 [Chryseobacterium sp. PMSZPI]
MVYSYIKTIVLFLFYLTYSKIYEYLLIWFSNKGILATIDRGYLYFADTIFCIPIIILYFIFFQKQTKPLLNGVNYKILILITLLAICFKTVENPITNINYIITNKTIKILDNPIDWSTFDLVLLFFNTVLIVPFTEELLFRRIALSYFSNSDLMPGLILSSILFALIHVDANINLLTSYKPIIMFFLGIITGLVYFKYGFIYSFIFHSTYNLLWCLLHLYRAEYLKILMNLNFGSIYWLIIFFSLGGLILLFRKLNLHFPLFLKKEC